MKKTTRIFFYLAILAMSICNISAQNEKKNWVFGKNAGIDFNGTSPAVSSEAAIDTNEGSSSISDSNGNLLFYTDGVQVWSADHQQMPNGFGLTGSFTSTHSALIVPCSCNRYFIFTPGTYHTNIVPGFPGRYSSGLRYSIVDMSLNGGLGDVVAASKNIELMPLASEKLAAVIDDSGGFWVVAHNIGNNQFYSYHISAGINCTLNAADRVISPVGAIFGQNSRHGGGGQMKFSPNGKRLAFAATHDPGGPSFIQLFQFDVSNGHVSNLANTTVRFNSSNDFYGLEFSPDSQSLYTTTVSGTNKVSRFDISTDTLSGPQTISSFGNTYLTVGALLLAPDEKIYVARFAPNGRDFLNMLKAPNDVNGGWTSDRFYLAPGSLSRYGLPSLIAGDAWGRQRDCVEESPSLGPTPGSWKEFKIHNHKYPVSDICSVDIDIRDAGGNRPPSIWPGCCLTVNGTPLSYPDWWTIFPFFTIPNGTNGQTVINGQPNSSSPAVSFRLGLPHYSPLFTGKMTLIIRHCDGTFSEWISGDWTS